MAELSAIPVYAAYVCNSLPMNLNYHPRILYLTLSRLSTVHPLARNANPGSSRAPADTPAHSIADTPEDKAEVTTTLSPPAELDKESFMRGMRTASMTGSAMAVSGYCLCALSYEKAGIACFSVLTAIALGMMTCSCHKALKKGVTNRKETHMGGRCGRYGIKTWGKLKPTDLRFRKMLMSIMSNMSQKGSSNARSLPTKAPDDALGRQVSEPDYTIGT